MRFCNIYILNQYIYHLSTLLFHPTCVHPFHTNAESRLNDFTFLTILAVLEVPFMAQVHQVSALIDLAFEPTQRRFDRLAFPHLYFNIHGERRGRWWFWRHWWWYFGVCVGGGIEFNVICRRANKKKSLCRQQRECGLEKNRRTTLGEGLLIRKKKTNHVKGNPLKCCNRPSPQEMYTSAFFWLY